MLFDAMIPEKTCTKINQFNIMVVTGSIKHHVFRLEITMHDMFLVGVSNRREKLFENDSNRLRVKLLFILKFIFDIVKQISTCAQFFDQAVSFRILKIMKHVDNTWMLYWMLKYPHALNFIFKFIMGCLVHISFT